jgi:hypothetical protein
MASIYPEAPDSPRVSMSDALAGVPASQASQAQAGTARFESIDHSALFSARHADHGAAHASSCDACAKAIGAAEDDGFSVPGRGLMLFTRGDERRAEEPHLCASCGAAIGMTMLSRWAIEEEEG